MLLRALQSKLRALAAIFFGSMMAHAAVTIDFVAPSSQWNTVENEEVFYVKANGGTVSGLRCRISALNPDHGDPAPRTAFSCSAPDSVAPNTISPVTLGLSPKFDLKRGSYTAVLQVMGVDPSGSAISQTVSFKVIVPAVALKVGETDTIRIRLTRTVPFFSAAYAIVPLSLRIASDLAPTRLPGVPTTQLYVQDGDAKDIVPGGYLKAYFYDTKQQASEKKDRTSAACTETSALIPSTAVHGLDDKTLYIEPSVPGNVQKASGVGEGS
jgi:hypothetical protein